MDPSTAVSLHIPHISISPAPPEEAVIEPYSPFSSTPITSSDEDAFRPRYLSPPPTLPTFSQIVRSLDDACDAADLGQERSQAQLPPPGASHVAPKAGDLRKQIAFKAHANTQGMVNSFLLFVVHNNPYGSASACHFSFQSACTSIPNSDSDSEDPSRFSGHISLHSSFTRPCFAPHTSRDAGQKFDTWSYFIRLQALD